MAGKFALAAAVSIIASPVAAGAQQGDLNAAFTPLIGQCWTAEFPGGTARDTHCFRLVEGDRYIEDRHIVSGGPQPYGGISYYRWDAAAKTIRYHYYANDGSFSEGSAVRVERGFDFADESHVGPDGKAMMLRTTWRLEAGGYSARTDRREGESWKPLFAMRFSASGPAPATGTLAADRLRISRAIVRAADAGDADVAGYVAIDNGGVEADRLISARCSCAGSVELHRVVRQGEKVSMETDWPLAIPPGARAEIKPGTALHLMLMKTTRPLKAGGSVPVILQFERAGAVLVDFHIVADSAKGWEGQ